MDLLAAGARYRALRLDYALAFADLGWVKVLLKLVVRCGRQHPIPKSCCEENSSSQEPNSLFTCSQAKVPCYVSFMFDSQGTTALSTMQEASHNPVGPTLPAAMVCMWELIGSQVPKGGNASL